MLVFIFKVIIHTHPIIKNIQIFIGEDETQTAVTNLLSVLNEDDMSRGVVVSNLEEVMDFDNNNNVSAMDVDCGAVESSDTDMHDSPNDSGKFYKMDMKFTGVHIELFI